MSVFSDFTNLKIPQVLYKTSSEYNQDIEVVKIGNTIRLKVNKITQSVNYDSPIVDRMVWGRVARLFTEEAPNMSSLLVLGLGGGTVQHLIHKSMPQVEIVSVEIDKVMYEIAKNFFHIDEIENHKVIIADAFRVVVVPADYGLSFQAFSAVYVDIYLGEFYPELGTSGNFMAHLVKMCQPGGLIVINRIYTRDHQEDVDLFIDNLSTFLHNVESIVIPGKTNADNIIIYGRA